MKRAVRKTALRKGNKHNRELIAEAMLRIRKENREARANIGGVHRRKEQDFLRNFRAQAGLKETPFIKRIRKGEVGKRRPN